MLGRVYGLIFGFVLMATPALADFGDCMEASYLSTFPEAPSAVGITCVEVFNIPVTTSSGESHIRGIMDISADWAFLPGALAGVERGVQLAVDEMGRLGGFEIDDVTILILDDAYELDTPAGEPTVVGMTNGIPGPDGSRRGECLITQYMFRAGADANSATLTTVHEIFHCLQYASLTQAQMNTVGNGGDWWIEGTASLFEARAVPDSEPSVLLASIFDADVEGGTPIYGMAHGAVVFFHWWNSHHAITELMPFMEGMASDGSPDAQIAAMRAAMSDDQWLEFAQDYIDSNIIHPHGATMPTNPGEGDTIIFEENGDEEITLEPFVLSRGKLEWTCGKWENSNRPAGANIAARGQAGGDWGEIRDKIDSEDPENGLFRFAALSTDPGTVTFSIDAERTRSCELCAESKEVDACLVGSWQQTGGGAIEWMRRHMPPGATIPVNDSGPQIMILRDDGTYFTLPFSQRNVIVMQGRDGPTTADGTGSVQMATGKWSISDGKLAFCQETGGLSGSAEVTTPRTESTMSFGSPGAATIKQSYSCGETSLQTSQSIPGISDPITTQFNKISLEE